MLIVKVLTIDGKKHTPENIALMKERAKNRTFNPKPCFKIEVENLNTKTKIVFNSIREAARYLNSHISSILR